MADEVQDLDVMDAAAQLNSLFAAEEKKLPPRAEDGKFTKAKSDEPAEPSPDVTPDGGEEPPAEAEASEDAEEVEEKDAPPAPRLIKVKLDGIEQELPEPEVASGYLRQADYTKKTQALAEERRRFEAEEVARVREERQAYADRLAALQEALETLAPSQEPDWTEASKTLTPEEFTQRFTAWKANRERIAKVEAEQARVRALHEEETAKERSKRLAVELERLHTAIPELKDPEKGKVLRQDLVDYATSIGYADDEVHSVEDHRALVLLHKARLWDESQKRRPKVEEKVDRALEALKPSGTKPAPKAKVADGLKSRLIQSGSVEDAAAYLNTIGFK